VTVGVGRRQVALGLLACACVLLVVGALVGAVDGVLDRGRRADANSRLDFADRSIAWGNGWTLSQDGLYAARSLVPEGASYEVRVGPESRFEGPLTYRFVASYLHYWLMPRRPQSGARWVVCYRCDRAELGDGARLLWDDPTAGVAVFDRRPGEATS
jgi:hypothetical protein